jgi:hypothetical protein
MEKKHSTEKDQKKSKTSKLLKIILTIAPIGGIVLGILYVNQDDNALINITKKSKVNHKEITLEIVREVEDKKLTTKTDLKEIKQIIEEKYNANNSKASGKVIEQNKSSN